jgi:prefoldin subunit 5
MDQYKKNGPGIKAEKSHDASAEIRRLGEQIKAQDAIIKELQTELRRLKTKIDRHAVHLNKIARG